MKWIIGILAVVLLVLAGCSSSDLPPEPSAPGAAGNYYYNIGSWVTEPASFRVSQDQILCSADEIVSIEFTASGVDYVLKDLYLYDGKTDSWSASEYPSSSYTGGWWIANSASQTISKTCQEWIDISAENEVFAVSYACTKVNGQWDCNNQWQLQVMNITEKVEASQFLRLNVPVLVDYEGQNYTLEIVGANEVGINGSSIILSVNGQRELAREGQTITAGGLQVLVSDMFITTVPNISASANIKILGTASNNAVDFLLELGQVQRIETDLGTTYAVEVVGGNSEGSSAIVSIDGTRYTIRETDTLSVKDDLIFEVVDISVTNIPSYSVFVGIKVLPPVDLPVVPGIPSVPGGSVTDELSSVEVELGKSVTGHIVKGNSDNIFASGVINTSYGAINYKQILEFETGSIEFGTTSLTDDPELHLDVSGLPLWSHTVSFQEGLGDSNGKISQINGPVMIAGKSFTFDPESDVNGDITLYSSDTKMFLSLNEPVTVEVDGVTATVEIVGASNENSNIILDVNGERKTVAKGDSTRIGAIDIYLEDAFITDFPTLSASANVFIGSNEVVLKSDGRVEINGESVSGLRTTRYVTDIPTAKLRSLTFEFTPSDLENGVSGFDEKEYVLPGEYVSDPLFGTFAVTLEDVNLRDDKSEASITSVGDEIKMTFIDNMENEVSFYAFSLENNEFGNTYPIEGKGYGGESQTIYEDQVFLLTEREYSNGITPLTKAYVLEDVSSSSRSRSVTLRNLADGTSKSYLVGKEIVNGYTITDVDIGSKRMTLSKPSTAIIWQLNPSKNNQMFNFRIYPELRNNTGLITYLDDPVTSDLSQDVNFIRFNIIPDFSDDTINIEPFLIDDSVGSIAYSDDQDIMYILTPYGTFIEVDVDEDEYARFYVPTNGRETYTVSVVEKDCNDVTCKASASGSGSGSNNIVTLNQTFWREGLDFNTVCNDNYQGSSYVKDSFDIYARGNWEELDFCVPLPEFEFYDQSRGNSPIVTSAYTIPYDGSGFIEDGTIEYAGYYYVGLVPGSCIPRIESFCTYSPTCYANQNGREFRDYEIMDVEGVKASGRATHPDGYPRVWSIQCQLPSSSSSSSSSNGTSQRICPGGYDMYNEGYLQGCYAKCGGTLPSGAVINNKIGGYAPVGSSSVWSQADSDTAFEVSVEGTGILEGCQYILR